MGPAPGTYPSTITAAVFGCLGGDARLPLRLFWCGLQAEDPALAAASWPSRNRLHAIRWLYDGASRRLPP
jgi:hypothetical protein